MQTGVMQNGMGPIAQKLTLEEAETLAARVGHVVLVERRVHARSFQVALWLFILILISQVQSRLVMLA